jgi:pimeloyl-ACP methyl ester carboxylesterase
VALPADRPRSYDQYLERLLEGLPRRGAWALLAESFSGPLAVRIAAERPRGLVGLALVATFLHRPLQRWLATFGPLVRTPLFAAPLLPRTVRLLLVGPAAPDDLVQAVRRAVAEVPAAVLARRAREALAVDVRRTLAATEVPLLYLGPAHDRLLRTDVAADVLAARPDADARMLAGPHAILQARPEACLAVLDPFFAAAHR